MSKTKVEALKEFDRAVRDAQGRGDGAYAYALGLVGSMVPTAHLLWAAEKLDAYRVRVPEVTE